MNEHTTNPRIIIDANYIRGMKKCEFNQIDVTFDVPLLENT